MIRTDIAGVAVFLLSMGCLRAQNTVIAEQEVVVQSQWGISKPARFVPDSPNPTRGISIGYNRLVARQDVENGCQRYARTGLLFQLYDFRNQAILGQSVSLSLIYEPLLAIYGRGTLSLVCSGGLAFVNRHFDRQTNPQNTAIGSNLNAITGIGLLTRYNLSPQWRLTGGLEFKHISNGGIKVPNQGLNVPALTIGLARYITAPQAKTLPRCPPITASELTPTNRWMARVVFVGSVRVLEATAKDSTQAYPIYGINVLGGYRIWRNSFLSGGVEALADQSFKEQLRRWGADPATYPQLTLLAGYEFWSGSFGITAHNGWNIVRPAGYHPATYQKYSILCKLKSGLTGGIALKAYGENTKNIQLLLGYSF